jgi:hypothetical protein
MSLLLLPVLMPKSAADPVVSQPRKPYCLTMKPWNEEALKKEGMVK